MLFINYIRNVNKILHFGFQLFYLVTNLFKEGNAKEMKKWAYEIHSSFLVPCAVSYFIHLNINYNTK